MRYRIRIVLYPIRKVNVLTNILGILTTQYYNCNLFYFFFGMPNPLYNAMRTLKRYEKKGQKELIINFCFRKFKIRYPIKCSES